MGNDPSEKTLGIVLKAVNYRDYDCISEIMTPSGKKTIIAKGVRKQTAKMKGAAQPFTYGEFVLYKKADRHTLTGYQFIDSFSPISDNVLKYACASVVLDIVDSFSFDSEESRDVFFLALRAIHTIAYDDMPPLDCMVFFILKLISLMGFAPSLDECVRCASTETEYFSVADGGVVCENCFSPADIKVLKGTVLDMKRTFAWPAEDMKLIRYSGPVMANLAKIALMLIENLSEKQLKSVGFLKSMKLVG
ncbi:MAG TPA: DNA repair protein RecO [Clostridia bacterium]|nr:DNA repair protein RecO [Clostridia bacterium]